MTDREPDWSKRYLTEDGEVRTLKEIMELCSDQEPAKSPALALWCYGARPEDGADDPNIDRSEFA